MPKLPAPRVRHLIPISGKDSLATAIVQNARNDKLPYEYIFCDVGMELPETYAWLDRVEEKMGWKIVRIGRSIEDIIIEFNMLPSHQRRFCTRYGKIFPIQDYVKGEQAIQYVGIRADEAERASLPVPENITAKFPLIEVGINLPTVYKLLEARDILPPSFFWERLYNAVMEVLGPVSIKWVEGIQPWVRSHFFSWRSRSNCFMCFYQRLYEWVGLLEHHPDLFERAEKLEYDFGNVESVNKVEAARLQNNFYWRPDGPLSRVRQRANYIFQNRVSAVRKAIVEARHSVEDEVDLIQLTSCGIYCGK